MIYNDQKANDKKLNSTRQLIDNAGFYNLWQKKQNKNEY